MGTTKTREVRQFLSALQVRASPCRSRMKIAVLAGGASAERDVSLLSGEMVCAALRRRGHDVAFVDSFLGSDVDAADIPSLFTSEEAPAKHRISRELPDIAALRAGRSGLRGEIGPRVTDILAHADITFNALHGGDGENGRIQSFLDILHIPYTGDGYFASALAMHKQTAKLLFAHAGVPVAPGCVYSAGSRIEWPGAYPAIVKPVASGSSVGVTRADSEAEMICAVRDMLADGSEALVEEFVPGREFAVGVLGGRALPVIEIDPAGGAYDYAHKYQSGLAVETCPAQIPDDVTRKMQDLAERACRALGIEVLARGEFILSDDGSICCLEMNTLPGMTPTSLLPQEAAAAGMSYEDLCEEIIRLSEARYGL